MSFFLLPPGLPQMTGFTGTELAAGCLVTTPSPGNCWQRFCWRRVWTRRLVGSAVVLTGWVSQVVGQESSGGGVRVETSGRSFTVEALVVAVFLGMALFSVCRSSRRV